MADMFDRKPKPKPSTATEPAQAAPPGAHDPFSRTDTAKPKTRREADSGVISDKAAAELKATAAEAAEKMKAGAGKLANQAGELASKAKTTWVPAVKTRISEVKMPRVPGKTLALGAAVVTALAIGAYAWHAHSTAPETKTAVAPSVATSIPAAAPIIPKAPGWNVAAGLKVLNADTGPKQALTCTLNFNPNIAGGWAHSVTSIPGFLTVLDPQHGIIQASTADVAQQALSAADFALDAKCLTAAELQAQAQPTQPVAPVEAPKPAPLPVLVPAKAPEIEAVKPAPVPAPVAVPVAPPTPAAVAAPQATTPAPAPKPVVVKAKPKPKAQPDTFEKNANAQLDAFFKH